MFSARSPQKEAERWWGSPDTYRVTDWKAEVSVGGLGSLVVHRPDGSIFPASGKFLEIDEPGEIVQTRKYDWDFPVLGRRDTTVTYRLGHEILNASPDELYRAVTDVKHLAHWWTTDARGESAIGNKLEFWFSGFLASIMEVTTLKPAELVQWRVIGGGAGDWIGSEVDFRIFRDQENQSVESAG